MSELSDPHPCPATAVGGASLLIGSWWPLILLPGALLAVRLLGIDREERYMRQRFGSIYDEYRTRVPRWL
jgi:protein-S-isoprenylcysteine O-methyltransferase Ste14